MEGENEERDQTLEQPERDLDVERREQKVNEAGREERRSLSPPQTALGQEVRGRCDIKVSDLHPNTVFVGTISLEMGPSNPRVEDVRLVNVEMGGNDDEESLATNNDHFMENSGTLPSGITVRIPAKLCTKKGVPPSGSS